MCSCGLVKFKQSEKSAFKNAFEICYFGERDKGWVRAGALQDDTKQLAPKKPKCVVASR